MFEQYEKGVLEQHGPDFLTKNILSTYLDSDERA